MNQDIINKLAELTQEKKNKTLVLKDSELFIIRADGTLLFSDGNTKGHSLSALMGGMWQAAQHTFKSLDKNENQNELKLSFGDADSGIFMTLIREHDPLYLSCIYKNILNPGLLRNELRILSLLMQEIVKLDKNIKNTKKDEYLFNNITDNEIDKLFTFEAN